MTSRSLVDDSVIDEYVLTANGELEFNTDRMSFNVADGTVENLPFVPYEYEDTTQEPEETVEATTNTATSVYTTRYYTTAYETTSSSTTTSTTTTTTTTTQKPDHTYEYDSCGVKETHDDGKSGTVRLVIF